MVNLFPLLLAGLELTTAQILAIIEESVLILLTELFERGRTPIFSVVMP